MLREVSWFCSFGGVRALVGLLFVTPHAPPSVFLGGFSHTFVKSILLEHFSFLPSARTHFYSFLLTLSFFFDIEGINLHSKILCNEYTKIDSKPNFFTCIHRISISRGTNFPDRFWNYQQVHTVSVQMGGKPWNGNSFFFHTSEKVERIGGSPQLCSVLAAVCSRILEITDRVLAPESTRRKVTVR